jgi:hypothetical protein
MAVLACDSAVLVEQISTLVDHAGVEVVKPVADVFTVVNGHVADIRTYRNDLERG